jgi:hypothetical protein
LKRTLKKIQNFLLSPTTYRTPDNPTDCHFKDGVNNSQHKISFAETIPLALQQTFKLLVFMQIFTFITFQKSQCEKEYCIYIFLLKNL